MSLYLYQKEVHELKNDMKVQLTILEVKEQSQVRCFNF